LLAEVASPYSMRPTGFFERVPMRNELKAEIKRLSKKSFDKIRSENETREKHREKFERRTGIPAALPPIRTQRFVHRHFNPSHCKRNANAIATAIWNKVLREEYDPEPAVQFSIPKPDGTTREVTAFGIPDAALANVLLRRTLQRNKKRLSPHSYAYHPDKNVFDAILALGDFDKDGKLFAVQIDFEKYFDNIPASYLKKKIGDRSTVSLTPHERHIFEAFLRHRFGDTTAHANGDFTRKVKGTPQGSSASLILANLANHDLDRKLAAESGKFVRFADDVVAICGSYEEALRLERCFDRHCADSGLIVNRKKSPGIAVISDHEQELRTINDFTYLGYGFRDSGLTLPSKTKRKLQQKVSRLINVYLINPLNHGFNHKRANRVRGFDWDLLGLICELRRGFYGGLHEQDVQGFLYNNGQLRKMRGLMGFYCLIDDSTVLKELDGWTVNMVRRACVKRREILQTRYQQDCPTPSNEQLILGSWINPNELRGQNGEDDDFEIGFPSLIRGWRAARKHFFTFGLEGVQAPGYNSSFDVSILFDALDY
jgi:RNA-directed DNA polymerase